MVELVDRFVKAVGELDQAVAVGNKQLAESAYRKLYDLYASFGASGLRQEDTEVAYDQIRKAYAKLVEMNKEEKKEQVDDRAEQPKKFRLLPVDVIAAGVIILVLGTLLFVKPQWVGLATFENSRTVDLKLTFTETGSHAIELDKTATGLRISGRVTGAGVARVYAQTSSGRQLLFDSSLLDLKEGEFTNACLDTCSGLNDKKVTLAVELSNAQLYIESISYTPDTSVNHEPEFVGTDLFSVKQGKELLVDAGKLFTDGDGDKLTYLSTNSPGLDVTVQGESIIFSGKTPGVKEITLLASDGQAAVRKQVTVTVN